MTSGPDSKMECGDTAGELMELLRKTFDAPPQINPETNIVADLGLESIQVIEYLCEVEDHFDLVIDEEALADALKAGRIAQAGVDVFKTEPITRDNPLLGLANCMLTAHVAGVTHPTTMRTCELAHENVRSVVVKGGRPRWIRNGV